MVIFQLTHWGLVAHMLLSTGSSLIQGMACHLFGAKPSPEPMINEFTWSSDDWIITIRNTFPWNFNQNIIIFLMHDKNVKCESRQDCSCLNVFQCMVHTSLIFFFCGASVVKDFVMDILDSCGPRVVWSSSSNSWIGVRGSCWMSCLESPTRGRVVLLFLMLDRRWMLASPSWASVTCDIVRGRLILGIWIDIFLWKKG